MSKNHANRGPGTALLMVLGFLSISLVLAVSLARLSAIERTSARTSLLSVRARTAAAAGIEHAVAGLRSVAAARSYDSLGDPWVYGGEDFDGDGLKSRRSEESFANGEFDVLECPVEFALRPSYTAIDTATGLPALAGDKPYSGRLDDLAYYALRVLASAAQLDVNAGLDDPRYAANIFGRIELVWDQIVTESPRAPDVEGVGDHLFANRPAGGYSSETQVRETLERLDPADPALGLEVFRRLAPFISCHPWRRSNVLVPVGDVETRSAADNIARYASLATTTRAPVDLNTAPYPVLYAVLADLAGWAYEEGLLYHRNPRTGLPDLDRPRSDAAYQPDRYRRTEIDRPLARDLARRIVERRSSESGPFTNWTEVDAFFDSLVGDLLTRFQADLVLAQAHPDTDLNKFDPTAPLARSVDKSDLIVHSTEFALSSMGRFEIESYAWIHDETGGEPVATAKIATEVVVYDVLEDSTIDDFTQGRTGPTPPDGQRSPVVIYPEEEAARALVYDGQLGLGTRSPVLQRRTSLHASFDPTDPAWPGKMEPSREGRLPWVGPLVATDPGTVFRGGAYSEEGLYPRFSTQAGYLSDTNGALSFWFKPNWDMTSAAPRPHALVDLNGERDDSTFQIYYDTKRPEGSDKGKPQPYIKFLAWDVGNKREAKIEIPIDQVTGPRDWIHVALRWEAKANRVSMTVASTEGQGSESEETATCIRLQYDLLTGQVTRTQYRMLSCDTQGPAGSVVPGWRAEDPSNAFMQPNFAAQTPTPPPDGLALEADVRAEGTAIRLWTESYPGGSLDQRAAQYRDWWTRRPRSSYREASYRSDVGEQFFYPPQEGGWFQRRFHVRWWLVPEDGRRVLTSGYSSTDPIAFAFSSDPTTALRLGGRLKLQSSDPPSDGEPPGYSFVPAPANGTYADILTFANIDPEDSSLGKDLESVFYQGRYYGAGDAWFESRELPLPPGTRLGTISWRAPAEPQEPAGLEFQMNDLTFTDSGSCALGVLTPYASNRYRILFTTKATATEPVLEPPFVDSVLVTVLSPARFFRWQEDLAPPPRPWTGRTR